MDRPRVYLSNDSYPELRDIQPRWAITVTWWRAIGHALRHRPFWVFAAVQIGLVLLVVAAAVTIDALRLLNDRDGHYANLLLTGGWFVVFAYLQVSWGADMMRPDLRAVSDKARYACPRCGHSLVGHLDGADDPIRCPECAARVDRDIFAPPYRVPPDYRVFPPWRRRPRAGS